MGGGYTSVIGPYLVPVLSSGPEAEVSGWRAGGSRQATYFLLSYPRKRSQSQTHRAVTVLHWSHCFSVCACWGGFHSRGKVSSLQECKAACLLRLLGEGGVSSHGCLTSWSVWIATPLFPGPLLPRHLAHFPVYRWTLCSV